MNIFGDKSHRLNSSISKILPVIRENTTRSKNVTLRNDSAFNVKMPMLSPNRNFDKFEESKDTFLEENKEESIDSDQKRVKTVQSNFSYKYSMKNNKKRNIIDLIGTTGYISSKLSMDLNMDLSPRQNCFMSPKTESGKSKKLNKSVTERPINGIKTGFIPFKLEDTKSAFSKKFGIS